MRNEFATISLSDYAIKYPGNHKALAGNLTQINLYSFSTTQSWQGYYGNVTEIIILSDSIGNNLYNWSKNHPTGQVYATRAISVNFSNFRCANHTEINSEEEFIGHNSGDVDSVTNTFNQNNHPEFYVGNSLISEDNCNSTNIFDENGIQTTKFFNVLLSDGASNIIYTSILEQSEIGFDSRFHDFQMIVGENGKDEETTSNYFYLEVN